MSNTPLSMRFPDADIDIIDRAARLRGRSRTDFVREAAVRAAEETLMDSLIIRMDPDSFVDFVAALNDADTHPRAPYKMAKSVNRPAPWEPGYKPPER
jgi:uncharacterized protein (DUF1778 family)